MTEIKHVAWYNLLLANIYAAAGKEGAFIAFLVVSVICFVASYLERKP